METGAKSPVQIIQEFIALHTTRKEAAERLKATGTNGDAATKMAAAGPQSDGFITELMEELSNYGDAVLANVDRDNAYQSLWNEALGKLEGMTPEAAVQTFEAMENSLEVQYQHTLETESEVPEPVREILTRQASQL
jgi:hypothetical protein